MGEQTTGRLQDSGDQHQVRSEPSGRDEATVESYIIPKGVEGYQLDLGFDREPDVYYYQKLVDHGYGSYTPIIVTDKTVGNEPWPYGKPEPSPLNKQVGGDHYKTMKIQPIEYIMTNDLGWCEGNIVKYITRWKQKGGEADIKKVIHYAELLLESLKK